MKSILFAILAAIALLTQAQAQTNWQDALAKMPLESGVTNLNETNCVPVTLKAFKQNPAVKALIFMPGATDEFYFFHRARVTLTNPSPTLLDAVVTLTNQTRIKASVRPPFLVLYTEEDFTEPFGFVEDEKTAAKLQKKLFKKKSVFDDRDWDYVQPMLSFYLNTEVKPKRYVTDSYHFFRHSFAAFNLNGYEILEAVAMAGKTRFTIKKQEILFQGDNRFRPAPPPPKTGEIH